MTKEPTHIQYVTSQCFHCGKTVYVKIELSQDFEEKEAVRRMYICPECGSTDVWLLDEIRDEDDYCCYKCKHTWKCPHEWHADQDNDCNFCVKCGARQEIYTE